MINGDLCHAYLGNNIVSIPEHLINIASSIKENSGHIRFIVHSTNYVDKAVLCHISEEVLNRLHRT
jgi:enoyl-[acyl-carrier-protein] reductase (NADH)